MKNQWSKARKKLYSILAMCLVLGISIPTIAQRTAGNVGIGAHIGQPTGLTLKFYKPTTSIDILAAWDLDDFLYVNVHGIWDEHLNSRQTIHFFYGPGVFLGVHDRGPEARQDEVGLGFSGTGGIDFLIGRFELFAQLTPRMELVRSTDFDIGGGIGFRFYL